MKVITRTDSLSREDWLEERSRGIGGSDAGAILGLNAYKSAWQLWAEKTGRIEDTFTGNLATRIGQALERPIAELYAQELAAEGLAVVAWPVLLQGAETYQLANVDFFICRPSEANLDQWELGKVNDHDSQTAPINIEALLEIKTGGMVGRGNADGWAEDSVPGSYWAQGCHYASVTGISTVHFVCLYGGAGLLIRKVAYSQPVIEHLNEAEAEFWGKLVLDEAPEVTGNDLDAIGKMYPESTDETVEADDIVLGLVREYAAQKATVDSAEAELKRLRAQLELVIGSASAVTYEGETLYTYKSTKSSETFDAKAFQEAHPDLAAQFTKTKPGYRVLKVAK